MTTALVTGSHGFVGSHLVVVLEEAGWRVVGLGRTVREGGPREYIQADVTDDEALTAIVGGLRPDVIFHLAAAVPQRKGDTGELVRSVVDGTKSVCTAIRSARLQTRLVLAGSSAQYGASSMSEAALTEESPCRPLSSYGYAKLAAEALAFALALDGSFELVAARAFNHVGPGEPPTTVAGVLASRVAAVLEERAVRIPISDVDAIRDFTDVRDIARGYLALAERGLAGLVYNLCSGRPTTVAALLDGLLDAAGLDRSIVDVVSDERSRLRRQVGSPARVRAETGWAADIPLARSLADLLDSARSHHHADSRGGRLVGAD